MKGRVAAWRRAVSVAFVSLAAVAVILGAGAGSASAAPQGPKKRMSEMPEYQYVIREELQELVR